MTFTVLLGYREWAILPLLMLLLAALAASRPYLFGIIAILLAGILLWNDALRYIRALRHSIVPAKPGYRVKIRVRDIRPDALVDLFRPLLRITLLQRMQDYIEDRIKSYILRSGTPENPRILGIKSVLYPIISFIVVLPAGILLYLYYDEVLLGLVLTPVLLFGLYFVILKTRASDRKHLIEDELAPFATLASIMESVNVSLYQTLVSLADSPPGIFEMMRREGRRIKSTMALGYSPVDALLDLSGSHPSRTFRHFVEGYVSSYNTGGADTSAYLQEQARRFFASMLAGMSRYTKQADIMAQVILTIMLLLPMMGLSMIFFASGEHADTMLLFLILFLPMISIILLALVHLRQPRIRDHVRLSWMAPVSGAATFALVYFLRGEIWEAAGAGIVAASLLNAIMQKSRLSEISGMDSPLPEFMRQMTRFKNIGVDMMRAMGEIRAEIIARQKVQKCRFNRTFDGYIDSLYRRISAGAPFESAVATDTASSWNARLVFHMLAKIHESGGGTAKILDDVTRWITEYSDARREMILNVRASLLTAFIGPVLMVLMLAVSRKLVAEFEENDATSQISGLALDIAPYAGAAGLSELLTIMAAACMGIVLSKINYFTARHTLFTGIITAFTMILLYMMPHFPI